MNRNKAEKAAAALASGALAALILAGAAAIFSSRYSIVIPRFKESCISVPFRLGLVDKWSRHPQERGELWAFRTRNVMGWKDGELFGKHIEALPLDHAEVTSASAVEIEGERIARGLPLAQRLGILPEKFVRSQVLGFGQYWALGTAWDSYDSRYWGALDESQIEGRFIVLF